MATAKSTKTKTTKTAAPAKAAKPAKAKPAVRHTPKTALAAKGSKDSVVGSLVSALARGDEDKDSLRARLLKASNSKLLRLVSVVDTVNKKFGGRDKLVSAIASSKKAAKDKDFVAKLNSLPLPQLLDLGRDVKR